MKLGFIGLGIMGSRMAGNLLKADYEVLIHNRTPEKAAPLVEKGAVWSDTPAGVGQQVQVLFTMLGNPDAVYHSAAGENGFLPALQPGTLWVDCSTVNPSFSCQMASLALERGVRFLDAPVTGSLKPAELGQLTFLIGGEKDDVEACQPFFSLMGSKVIHVGGHGMGSSLKMVANQMLGVTMAAFSEALHLGQALGIPPDILFNTFPSMPVNAPFLAAKKEKITAGDFSAEFPLKWLQKDLHLLTLTAQENGVAVPVAGLCKEIYQLAICSGMGEEDFSAIFKMS